MRIHFALAVLAALPVAAARQAVHQRLAANRIGIPLTADVLSSGIASRFPEKC